MRKICWLLGECLILRQLNRYEGNFCSGDFTNKAECLVKVFVRVQYSEASGPTPLTCSNSNSNCIYEEQWLVKVRFGGEIIQR